MIYLASVARTGIADNGRVKAVKEKYLIDAMTYTEAEARLTKVLAPLSSEYGVPAITQAKVAEIIEGEGTRWYKAVVNMIVLDEKSAEEKKKACNMFLRADSFISALRMVESTMERSLGDYEIANITETNIVDYLKYTDGL